MNHYSHITFVDEDFFCNCENKCWQQGQDAI
jgi:hypothetical protein